MAHPSPTGTHPGSTQHPVVDRSENVADDLPDASETGADEVGSAAVSVAVTYPDWRREELARKYGGWDSDGR